MIKSLPVPDSNHDQIIRLLEEKLRYLQHENNQLQAAVRNSAAGIVISEATKHDNPICFANPAFTAMTGYSAAEVVGRNCRFLQGASTNPGVLHEIREAIAAGQAIRRILVNYRKDGTPFWNELTINPIYDEAGTLVNFVGIQSDVTERMEQEAALRRAHDEMETRVRVRTADLKHANEALQHEIDGHLQTEAALKKSQEELRALAAHLDSVQEEERARIAREIHDELGQILTGLKMELSWVQNRWPQNDKDRAVVQKMEAMSSQIDASIQSVRKIASDLRPGVLDRFGLNEALLWQTHEFQKRAGIRCSCSSEIDDSVVGRDRSLAIFRITQEALTNVARHANASRVAVKLLQKEGHLLLEIKDNGQGMREKTDSNKMSLGLIGMQERAWLSGGEFHIKSGKGTTVSVKIPLERRKTSDDANSSGR